MKSLLSYPRRRVSSRHRPRGVTPLCRSHPPALTGSSAFADDDSHGNRREFLGLIGGAAAASLAPSLAAHAQPSGAMPVIGFLNPNRADAYPDAIAAFHAGLRESGYVAGENVTILYRWADGHLDRLPALVADLVAFPVTVIAATGGGTTAVAAKAATSTIPIVFNSAEDPVKAGFVASLNRPGGNLTGVSRLSVELMPKRLEFLHEIVPEATPVAYLVERNSALSSTGGAVQEAASKLDVEIRVVGITTETNLDAVIAGAAQSGMKAMLIGSSSYLNSQSRRLGELCLHHKIPAVYQTREFVAAGGLLSYGPSLPDAYRIIGAYTGRVLKGARPADLPVQQQTKIDLIINLRTARTLGLTISLPLLGRADEVIE